MPLQCGCFAAYHCCYHGGAAKHCKNKYGKKTSEKANSFGGVFIFDAIYMYVTIRAAYIVLQISFPWAFCHI